VATDNGYRRFGDTYCLHIQDQAVKKDQEELIGPEWRHYATTNRL